MGERKKRLYGKARAQQRQWLLATQGPKCLFCEKPWTEVDHINADPTDNRPENVRGLSKDCNLRIRNLQAGNRKMVVRNKGEREFPGDADSSLEVQINVELFPRFQAWVWEEIIQRPPVKVKHAIHAGAMYLRRSFGHGSSTTTRKWLNDLTSEEGPFEVWESKEFGRCVRFRIEGEN